MSQSLHPMLNVAIKAARAAGAIINRAALDVDLLKISVKGPNDFVSEVDRAAEAVVIDVAAGLPRPRHPRRGVGLHPRQPHERIPLDHRSARRHHQLPARPADLCRVDRVGASQRGAAGGGVRPGAQRPVLLFAGPWRVPERPPAARQQAHRAWRCADRHRLPVPPRRRLRALHADDAVGDAELCRRSPPRRGRARPVLRGRRLVRRLLRDRLVRPGTWPPAR